MKFLRCIASAPLSSAKTCRNISPPATSTTPKTCVKLLFDTLPKLFLLCVQPWQSETGMGFKKHKKYKRTKIRKLWTAKVLLLLVYDPHHVVLDESFALGTEARPPFTELFITFLNHCGPNAPNSEITMEMHRNHKSKENERKMMEVSVLLYVCCLLMNQPPPRHLVLSCCRVPNDSKA